MSEVELPKSVFPFTLNNPPTVKSVEISTEALISTFDANVENPTTFKSLVDTIPVK